MPEDTRSVAVDSPVETEVQHVVSPIKGLSDPRTEGDSPPTAAAHGFDLLTEVGRGGMGVVFRARDLALGRDVAVKLLQERFTASPATTARFLAEARITAQLQHPGIPPVYEVGTLPDGRPFLAMKLIKGQTLDDLLKVRGDEPPGSLEDRGRFLAIFEQVCHAVGYAHEHGVIHRDLKPGNIMVGAHGEVQVMDWGLAKVLTSRGVDPPGPDDHDTAPTTQINSEQESDAATRAGSVIGTPAFMPPEQAIGAVDQIDSRSDVFGLGAILCVILTGQPPYVGVDPESTRQLSARAQLGDAFARLEFSGGESEVVALCKRCLAAEKSNRPATAGAVAQSVATLRTAAVERARQADLDRVRAEGERAKAEAEAREQRKRRRIWLGLAATLLLGLIAALTLAAWARSAEQQAVENANRAINNEKLASSNAKLAGDRLMLVEAEKLKAESEKRVALAVRDFLRNSLIRQTNVREQATARLGAKTKELKARHDITIRELLERAAHEFSPETIESKFPNQPEAQAEILETIGEAFETTGDYKEAIRFVSASWRLLEKSLGPHHPKILAGITNAAFTHLAASRPGDAVSLILTMLERLEVILAGAPAPGTSPSAFVGSGAEGDSVAAALDAVLETVKRRLDLRRYTLPVVSFGVTEGAIALMQISRTLPRLQRLATLANDRFGENDLRACFADLAVGFGFHATGQLSKAVAIYEATIARAERLLDPDDMLLCGLRLVLFVGYEAQGVNHQKTLPILEKAYQTMVRVLGDDHPSTLSTLNAVAYMTIRGGNATKAIDLLERARNVAVKTFGLDNPDTLTMLNNLAAAYLTAGKLPEAIALFEQVRDAMVKKLGADHLNTLSTLHSLAAAYRTAGKLPEAIALFEQVRDGRVKQLGDYHPDTLTTLHSLAGAYQDAGKLPEAITLFEQASRGIEKRRFLHQYAGRIILNTAGAYEGARQFDRAEAWRRKWLAVVKQKAGVESPGYADELEGLGLNLIHQKKWTDAETTLRECLAIREKAQPNAWATFNTRSMLGEALLGLKQYTESEPLLVAGYDGLRQREKTTPPQSLMHLRLAGTRLIDLYAATGRPEKAATLRATLPPESAPLPRVVK